MAVVARRRRWLPFSGWHLLLMPTALLFALPLVWMILTSFMPDGDINRFPPKFFPTSISLTGYHDLFNDSDIARWLINSAIVSIVAVVSHLVLCSLAGYGFARLRFAGRTLTFFLIVATIMVPIQLLMIPTFIMFSRIGVIDTLPAVTIPWLASAFGIFLMRQFFLALPIELEDAARLDGCNRLQLFVRIVLAAGPPRAGHPRDLHAARRVERSDLAADRDQQRQVVHRPARTGELPGHAPH